MKQCWNIVFFVCFFFQGSPTNNVSPTSTPAKSSNAVPTLQPPPAAGAAGDGAAGPAASEPAEEYVSAEPLRYVCVCEALCDMRLLCPLDNCQLLFPELCFRFHGFLIILMLMNRCNAVNDNMKPGRNDHTHTQTTGSLVHVEMKCHYLIFSSSLLDLDPLSSSGPSAPSAAPTSWGGKHLISFRSKTFHCF